MLNLLRVEAINFDQSIGDTNQLSVVRGGGLLMRESIIDLGLALEQNFPKDGMFHKVSTGGSIGIFLFRLEHNLEASVLIEALEDALSGASCSEVTPSWLKNALCQYQRMEAGKATQWLSFAVSVQPVHEHGDLESVSYESFRDAEQRALAEIRRKQMQQPNVVIAETPGAEVCAWDGLRPASGSAVVREVPVSDSVHERFKIGRSGKQDGPLFRFFSRELKKIPDADDAHKMVEKAKEVLNRLSDEAANQSEACFPLDLQELCGAIDGARHSTKLAVLYADGNKFGRIVGDGLASVQEYEQWDGTLQQSRARFLASLLVWLDRRRAPGEPLPLEIFLWGGDELMLAVPGDLALEAVFRFFDFTKDLHWGRRSLTHSLGLVICNYKTPIHRIKTLAIGLADRVKKELGGDPEAQKNAWLYAVLESVDTPSDLDTFFSKRFDKAAPAVNPLCLPESDFEGTLLNVYDIDGKVPRSQLYRIAHQLSKDPSAKECRTADLVDRFKTVTGEALDTLSEEMYKALPQLPLEKEQKPAALASRLLHWMELLDYWPVKSAATARQARPQAEKEVGHE
jgi:hypothetical protein